MKIKRFLLVLLGGLFCNALVFAQSAPLTLEGKATQEMDDEEIAAAANRNFPFDSTIKITNTETGKEIYAPVKGRIVPSRNSRIVDLSRAAWEALGLNADTIVTITLVPPSQLLSEILDTTEYQDKSEPEERTAELRPAELRPPETSPAEIRPAESRPAESRPKRETPRSDFSQPLYHLLVLDRTYSALNSDIAGIESAHILYKFKHGKNGYLIALYTSMNGPVFPVTPNKSRIMVNTTTTQKIVLKEYINSASFRRFVSNPTVLSQLQKVLEGIKTIPTLPQANYGKTYRIQVGSYAKPENAAAAMRMLNHAGFAAGEEWYGSLRRVFAKDIPAAEISAAVQRLKSAGFTEVWIRE
jgi:hypothetical protein